MSLGPRPIEPVPEDTARVAKSASPRGDAYMARATSWAPSSAEPTSPHSSRPATGPWSRPGGSHS